MKIESYFQLGALLYGIKCIPITDYIQRMSGQQAFPFKYICIDIILNRLLLRVI